MIWFFFFIFFSFSAKSDWLRSLLPLVSKISSLHLPSNLIFFFLYFRGSPTKNISLCIGHDVLCKTLKLTWKWLDSCSYQPSFNFSRFFSFFLLSISLFGMYRECFLLRRKQKRRKYLSSACRDSTWWKRWRVFFCGRGEWKMIQMLTSAPPKLHRCFYIRWREASEILRCSDIYRLGFWFSFSHVQILK